MRRPGLSAQVASGATGQHRDGDGGGEVGRDGDDDGFARAPAGGGEGEGLDGSGRMASSCHRALVLTPSRPPGARTRDLDGRALRDQGWHPRRGGKGPR
jgi:hypothetical protein